MSVFEVVDCADFDPDFKKVSELFTEYSKMPGAESCFVSFSSELSDLGSCYSGGAVLLGLDGNVPVACVALKKTSDKNGEVKRLYVKPDFRGNGYSKLMLSALFDRARKLGFETLTLKTKPEIMDRAWRLYRRLGFFRTDEQDGVVSMCMKL